MLVTLLGIVTDVRPEQELKAERPMLVTLLGIVMDVRPEQELKALSPMLVTLLGIVMAVRPEQLLKAELQITFVPELTMTELFGGIEPLYEYNTSPRYTTPSGWSVNQGVP